MSWAWKDVDTKDAAHDATRPAVGVSYFIAAATGLFAILSIVYGHAIFGIDGWSLLDAILFTVIGWRIGKLSRAWTVAGLALYLIEVAVSISDRGFGPGVLSIVFILMYVNAVRGVFAYHRFVKLERAIEPLPDAGLGPAQP